MFKNNHTIWFLLLEEYNAKLKTVNQELKQAMANASATIGVSNTTSGQQKLTTSIIATPIGICLFLI